MLRPLPRKEDPSRGCRPLWDRHRVDISQSRAAGGHRRSNTPGQGLTVSVCLLPALRGRSAPTSPGKEPRELGGRHARSHRTGNRDSICLRWATGAPGTVRRFEFGVQMLPSGQPEKRHRAFTAMGSPLPDPTPQRSPPGPKVTNSTPGSEVGQPEAPAEGVWRVRRGGVSSDQGKAGSPGHCRPAWTEGEGRQEGSGFNSGLKSPRETADVVLAEQVLRRQKDLAHQWAVCSSSSGTMS